MCTVIKYSCLFLSTVKMSNKENADPILFILFLFMYVITFASLGNVSLIYRTSKSCGCTLLMMLYHGLFLKSMASLGYAAYTENLEQHHFSGLPKIEM